VLQATQTKYRFNNAPIQELNLAILKELDFDTKRFAERYAATTVFNEMRKARRSS
jgi:hypothetical protein